VKKISIDTARRISLAAQGFSDARPKGRVDVRHFRRVMGRLGLIQLDSVNVCVRTHYMPFYSRLGAYQQHALDAWLNESGEHFEYWAHEASILPVDRYPLWRWRMGQMGIWRSAQALFEAHPGLLHEVRRQVDENGPLTVRDLDAPNDRKEAWWGYGPGKICLEVLFAQGEITARRTGNFTRLYDMPHRAIPEEWTLADAVGEEEAYRTLLGAATTHHGIGTLADIADYFRLNIPKARPIFAAMVKGGEIEEVEVSGWSSPAYIDPQAARPRAIKGTTLLSPFDPVVWHRERAERLFDFRYRIEIYVPKPKRVYGYYVLPLMVDGALVGRVDLKADRKKGTLLVRSAFREEGTEALRVARELSKELERFAGWLNLGSIKLERKGNLMADLRRAM
jgi:uncharacterized protein YcaQ